MTDRQRSGQPNLRYNPKDSDAEKERKFRAWYTQRAARMGLDPNPDAPEHKYDYRAAWRAGDEPAATPTSEDVAAGRPGEEHWPSKYKAPDHPNRFVEGADTRYEGEPIPRPPSLLRFKQGDPPQVRERKFQAWYRRQAELREVPAERRDEAQDWYRTRWMEASGEPTRREPETFGEKAAAFAREAIPQGVTGAVEFMGDFAAGAPRLAASALRAPESDVWGKIAGVLPPPFGDAARAISGAEPMPRTAAALDKVADAFRVPGQILAEDAGQPETLAGWAPRMGAYVAPYIAAGWKQPFKTAVKRGMALDIPTAAAAPESSIVGALDQVLAARREDRGEEAGPFGKAVHAASKNPWARGGVEAVFGGALEKVGDILGHNPRATAAGLRGGVGAGAGAVLAPEGEGIEGALLGATAGIAGPTVVRKGKRSLDLFGESGRMADAVAARQGDVPLPEMGASGPVIGPEVKQFDPTSGPKLAAAVLTPDGKLLVGATHPTILNEAWQRGVKGAGDGEPGFVRWDQPNRFLNYEEGLAYAQMEGIADGRGGRLRAEYLPGYAEVPFEVRDIDLTPPPMAVTQEVASQGEQVGVFRAVPKELVPALTDEMERAVYDPGHGDAFARILREVAGAKDFEVTARRRGLGIYDGSASDMVILEVSGEGATPEVVKAYAAMRGIAYGQEAEAGLRLLSTLDSTPAGIQSQIGGDRHGGIVLFGDTQEIVEKLRAANIGATADLDSNVVYVVDYANGDLVDFGLRVQTALGPINAQASYSLLEGFWLDAADFRAALVGGPATLEGVEALVSKRVLPAYEQFAQRAGLDPTLVAEDTQRLRRTAGRGDAWPGVDPGTARTLRSGPLLSRGAAEAAMPVGGAAYGYATGDDPNSRVERALGFGTLGAAGSAALASRKMAAGLASGPVPGRVSVADAPGQWYDRLAAAAESFPQEKATPEQWIAALTKGTKEGVSEKELQYTQIREWLGRKDPTKVLTKEEVVAEVRARIPRMGVVDIGSQEAGAADRLQEANDRLVVARFDVDDAEEAFNVADRAYDEASEVASHASDDLARELDEYFDALEESVPGWNREHLDKDSWDFAQEAHTDFLDEASFGRVRARLWEALGSPPELDGQWDEVVAKLGFLDETTADLRAADMQKWEADENLASMRNEYEEAEAHHYGLLETNDASDLEYEQYTVPGGREYAETLLVVKDRPLVPVGFDDAAFAAGEADIDNAARMKARGWTNEDGSPVSPADIADAERLAARAWSQIARAEVAKGSGPGGRYQSPHFKDVENFEEYVLHVRSKVRDWMNPEIPGKPDPQRVITGPDGAPQGYREVHYEVDEIQSDIHQSARDFFGPHGAYGPEVNAVRQQVKPFVDEAMAMHEEVLYAAREGGSLSARDKEAALLKDVDRMLPLVEAALPGTKVSVEMGDGIYTGRVVLTARALDSGEEVFTSELYDAAYALERYWNNRVGLPMLPLQKQEEWGRSALELAMQNAIAKGADALTIVPWWVHANRYGTQVVAWVRQADGTYTVTVKGQSGGVAGGVNIEQEALARGLTANPTNDEVATKEDFVRIMKAAGTYGGWPGGTERFANKLWALMQDQEVGVTRPRLEGTKRFYEDTLPKIARKLWKGLADMGTIYHPDHARPLTNVGSLELSAWQRPSDGLFVPVSRSSSGDGHGYSGHPHVPTGTMDEIVDFLRKKGFEVDEDAVAEVAANAPNLTRIPITPEIKDHYRTKGGRLWSSPVAQGAAVAAAAGTDPANEETHPLLKVLGWSALAAGGAGVGKSLLMQGKAGAVDAMIRGRPGPTGKQIQRVLDSAKLVSIDPENYVRLSKFHTDPNGEKVLREEVQRVVAMKGDAALGKVRVTHEQTKQMAREVGIELGDLDLKAASRLTGAEMLALRNIISSNVQEMDRVAQAIATARSLGDGAAVDYANRLFSGLQFQTDRLLAKFIKARAETGRALNSLKIIANRSDSIVTWNVLAERTKGYALDSVELMELQRLLNAGDRLKVVQYVQGLRKSGIGEKAITLWKTGLLTNPTTHLANLTGNTTMAALMAAGDVPAKLFDIMFARISGLETKAGLTTDVMAASMEGVKKGWAEAKQVMKTGITDDALTKYDIMREVNFDNVFLDTYTKGVFRSLAAGDKVFRGITLMRSLAEQATVIGRAEGFRGRDLHKRVRELIDRPTDEMVMRSIADAEVATFLNKGVLGSAGLGLRRALGPIGEAIMPFVMTPANVATRIMEFSGGGALATLVPLGTAKQGSGVKVVWKTPDLLEWAAAVRKSRGAGLSDTELKGLYELQKRIVEGWGRSTLGVGAIALGYSMYEAGMLTGNWPSDANEGQVMKQSGLPANSVKFGDHTWLALDRISPLGNLLTLGAEVARLAEQPDARSLDVVAGSAASIGKTLVSQSFLQGVQGVLDMMNDPDRSATRFLSNLGASVVPSVVGAASRALDPTMRDTSTPKSALLARTPFSGSLPPLVDALGEDRRRVGSTVGRLSGLVSPFRVAQDMLDDELRIELYRLGVGVSEYRPGDLTVGSGPGKRPFPGPLRGTKEYADVQREYGQAAREEIASKMSMPQYQRATDEKKKEMLEDAVGAARRKVTERRKRAFRREP